MHFLKFRVSKIHNTFLSAIINIQNVRYLPLSPVTPELLQILVMHRTENGTLKKDLQETGILN